MKRFFGKNNNNWKGGRSISSGGYVLIRVGPKHHLADVRGYAYEHRIKAEQFFGRRLKKGEQVHHVKEKQKQNNRRTNLKICRSIAWHRFEHRKPENKLKLRLPNQPNPTVKCRCGCGQKFRRFDKFGRPRFYVSGHNPHGGETLKKFLKAITQPSNIFQISARTGQSPRAVRVMASKLARANHIIRISRGIYGRKD